MKEESFIRKNRFDSSNTREEERWRKRRYEFLKSKKSERVGRSKREL